MAVMAHQHGGNRIPNMVITHLMGRLNRVTITALHVNQELPVTLFGGKA